MRRTLVLFAHPALEKSRVHSRLLAALPPRPELTVHDLYEQYPEYWIDVDREKALLTTHDLIVMQHPFYWYSTPPLLKQWMDLVLEHGWAYGAGGTALRGKWLINVVSTGGSERAYQREGHNRFTVRELLAPIEQTARLCGMSYLPPYVVFGSHRLDPPDIEREAEAFGRAMALLATAPLDPAALDGEATLNAALASPQQLGEVPA